MKILKIIISSILILFLIYILFDYSIIFYGTGTIGENQYPKILAYGEPIINFFVMCISIFLVFKIIKGEKYIFLKLFGVCICIALLNYVLFYLHKIVVFSYFPSFDASIISSKQLGMYHREPEFNPIDRLFIYPFVQLYYYIPGSLITPFHTLVFFINQGIFQSIIIPLAILLSEKINNKFS